MFLWKFLYVHLQKKFGKMKTFAETVFLWSSLIWNILCVFASIYLKNSFWEKNWVLTYCFKGSTVQRCSYEKVFWKILTRKTPNTYSFHARGDIKIYLSLYFLVLKKAVLFLLNSIQIYAVVCEYKGRTSWKK